MHGTSWLVALYYLNELLHTIVLLLPSLELGAGISSLLLITDPVIVQEGVIHKDKFNNIITGGY